MVDDQTPEAAPEPEPTPDPPPEPPAAPQAEPIPVADAPPAADPAAPTDPAAPAAGVDDPAQENPIMAALSYIICPLLGIIILVTDMKKSRYMRLHGWQSIFLGVAYVAISIIYSVISAIPVVQIVALTGCLVGPAVLVVSIIAAVKAYNKQEWLLPLIGQMAVEQADKMRV